MARQAEEKTRFEALPAVPPEAHPFKALLEQPSAVPAPAGVARTALLHGFDLSGAPVLSGLAQHPGELVAARSTVPLRQSMIGAAVVVLHEDADPRRPIVIGVLQQEPGLSPELPMADVDVDVRADGQRLVLSAEREIVLRCGEASITLTRAGKILIQGRYVLSRSSGYNKIKGAAVDIN